MLLKALLFACLAIHLNAQISEEAEKTALLLMADEKLMEYGYVKPSDIGQLMTTESQTFQNGLKDYQTFAGIPATGELDDATIKKMHQKRCGDPDKFSKRSRVRRWNKQGTMWENGLNLKLRWRLFKDCNDLPRKTVLRVLRQAFQLWSDVTNLQFTETDDADPEIRVMFASNRHGDPYPFDGQGSTLAHAFYPLNNKGLSGDCHFDDDEVFSAFESPPYGKIDLLWVAVHEIGHSIGLAHSNVVSSIMYPWYRGSSGWTSNLQLRADDISGIQYIYGKKGKKGKKVACPALSKNGRCGAAYGRCATSGFFCNINNGWCGSTDAHRDASPDDLYDNKPFRDCTLKEVATTAKPEPTTKPKPQPTTGPETIPCEDFNINCPDFKSRCSKGGWYTRNCPKTCEITCYKPECTNKSGDDECKHWKICNKPKSHWMQYCYKECSGC